MQLYFFIATHLPELAHCWKFLQRSPDAPDNLVLCFPSDLPWPLPDDPPPNFQNLPSPPSLPPVLPEPAFVLLDPRYDPEPQLAAWAGRLRPAGLEPAKILTLVDCSAAEQHPPLREYLRHCLTFADLVLLGNRTKASKSFIASFQKEFQKACYPCRFSVLKGQGLPPQPSEILTPETRRLSTLFDPPEIPGEAFNAAGFPIESSWGDEDDVPHEWSAIEEAFLEDEAAPKEQTTTPPPPDPSPFLVTWENLSP